MRILSSLMLPVALAGSIFFASGSQAQDGKKANAAAVPALARFTPLPGRALCRGADGYAQEFGGRRTFFWRPEQLNAIRDNLPAHKKAIDALLQRADAALQHGPYTVVDKRKTPASGDKHDYYSIGPYWWPDPSKRSGEPYIRRDGRFNPERDGPEFDTADLDAMSSDVEALGLAYFYTDDKRYANQAAMLLRAWFIAPETRMNPNFAHAQAIPGKVSGRKEGVIDASRLMRVVEAIGLIEPAQVLAPDEHDILEKWFGDLVTWMATSPNGRAERAKDNNHGIYFDLLASQFSLFARMEPVTRTIIGQFPARRIAVQFAADGTLPEELTRTRTWHYTNWTLTAVTRLAALGECTGQDLWKYQLSDGRGLRKSIDFMVAFAGHIEDWPYTELAFQPGGQGEYARRIYLETLRTSAWGYGDPKYEKLAAPYAAEYPDAPENTWLGPYAAEHANSQAQPS